MRAKRGKGVERFGVSIDPELLRQFDKLIEEKGYSSRSEAIRDLIRETIALRRLDLGAEEAVATITIIYDPDVRGLTSKLLHIQHSFPGQVRSTTHVHLEKHLCLEVIVASGNSKEVISLGDKLRALKGVKHGGVVITSV